MIWKLVIFFVRNNNLDMIKWLTENSYKCDDNSMILAFDGQKFDMINYLYNKNIYPKDTTGIDCLFSTATLRNSLTLLM